MPKRIGSYDIGECIGRGGMGEVYWATHSLLHRDVAIKRLLPGPGVAEDPDLEERFLREGRALAELSHQNIVGIHDLIERKNGELFMVLDLVDGFDLSTLVRKEGALPMDVVASVGIQLSDALQYAHEHSIVHRDIKAPNVMLTKKGEVKLMDFGVARDDRLEDMTATGMVVGTPMYVAPEVIKGQDANAQSDLYALGALLYYLLSGKRLYEGVGADRLFHDIAMGRFVPLNQVSSEVPTRMMHIVHGLLERDPARRYGSGNELRRDLELALAEAGIVSGYAQRIQAYLWEHDYLDDEDFDPNRVSSLPQARKRPVARGFRRYLGFWMGILAAGLGVLAWFYAQPDWKAWLAWLDALISG